MCKRTVRLHTRARGQVEKIGAARQAAAAERLWRKIGGRASRIGGATMGIAGRKAGAAERLRRRMIVGRARVKRS